MDKQEAILRIEDHIRVHRIGKYPHIHIAEALKMAMEALRAQPENKPLTNSDRFRRMSDEEIAKILVSDLIGEKIPFCKNKPECDSILDSGECIPESMCAVCAIDWLRKEPTHER